MILPIETYKDCPITLDTERGLFYADTEGEVQTIEAPTLHEVRDRIDAYLTKVEQETRKQRQPVPIVIVHKGREGLWELHNVLVYGVVAGRPYNAVLRVTEGAKSHHIDVHWETVFFHPDDPMLVALRAECTNYCDTLDALHAIEKHVISLTKEGTKIKVPGTKSKEDAIDNERLLHEQLSAITPTKE